MTERVLSEVLELDVDRCQNTYGIAPCTAAGAAGTECYNTFRTCQDKPNFVKGTQIVRFTGIGSPINPASPARPYISRIARAPTELDPEEGLAVRSASNVTVVDEQCADVEFDPYIATRATPAGGTFWTRFLARNLNYAGRAARLKKAFVDRGTFTTGVPAVYLSLPGTASNYPSTPDTAAVSITGDIDLRIDMAPTSWNNGADQALIDKESAYFLRLNGGTIKFVWYVATVATEAIFSDPGFTAGTRHWVRVTLDVNDGGGGRIATCYTSADGVTWAQLGSTVTGAATSIDDSTTVVALGTRIASSHMAGNIYYAEIRNGIGGTVVAKFDPSQARANDKAFTSSTGEVWTINQSGTTPAVLVGVEATELYIIDKIAGPNGAGELTITLKDPTKLADRSTSPVPTSGKLAAALGPSDLAIVLNAGEGAQYNADGWVRIGDEIIRFDGNAGDILTLSSPTYRGQFGTEAAAGAIDDNVQVCWVYEDFAFSDVIIDLLNSAGIQNTSIDTAGIAAEDATWLGADYRITRCISDPTDNAELLADLLQAAEAMLWWDPVAQLVKMKVFAPQSPAFVVAKTLDESGYLIERSVSTQRLEDLRITLAAVYFGLTSAVVNVTETKSYRYGELTIDADAESANEYNERRTQTFYVPWFGQTNIMAMRSHSRRYVARHRDAPEDLFFDLDPKDDDITLGQVVDVQSKALVNTDGSTRTARVLITRKENLGTSIKYRARVTAFDQRYGFIGPATEAAYPANAGYMAISDAAGLMSDGTDGYLII